MIDDRYFARLIPELVDRTGSATRSWLRLSSKPLRQHLSNVMGEAYGQSGSLLADPVFEATFGWEAADVTLGGLAGSFLHEQLVEAMANPPADLRDEYRFDRATRPYRHQHQAWQWLGQNDPRSAIITSGTGSGKTECFLVPILDRLVREWAHKRAPLVGVRALFLYPLNALINSQRDRLRAWTDAFDDGVRFCLYNGLTPESVRHVRGVLTRNQIADRKTLRATPPPILLTNPTMLEYMLVRSQDAPILEASRGKLEWIVLDEAHTYIGSQAAELALLLRRVMHAFDVHPANVRFVATSATIGDPSGEAGRHLQQFLADLAGIDAEQVCVVAGQRRVPALPCVSSGSDISLESLSAIDAGNRRSTDRYAALCSSPTARRLRQRFDPAEGGRAAWRLSELADSVPADAGDRSARALAWLDLLTGTVSPDTKHGDTPFLPLRAHLFHNVLPGLSACVDRACPSRKGTALDSADWPFGLVFLGMRQRCDCGAPAYEIRACNDCDTVVLWAEQELSQSNTRILPCTDPSDDEFALELDPIEGSDEEEDLQEPEEEGARYSVLIANRFPEKTTAVALGVTSQVLDPEGDERTVIVHLREADADDPGGDPKCPCCEFGGNFHRNGYRATRVGAPFLLGNILPTLLEYCPESKTPLEAPYRGRRMLSFTDSRQGTARIAIKIQQDAERNRMRGLVYQTLAMESGDTGAVDSCLARIRELEPHAHIPAVRTVLEEERSKLRALREYQPILLRDLANKLAVNASDLRNMQPAYADLDPEVFAGDNGRVNLAFMLLGREFLRRPKRLNNLETMGLVSVHYPALDKARAPSGFDLPIDDADWRGFLKIALDYFVRQAGAVDQPDHWRRWGGQRVGRPTILPHDSMERAGKAYRFWPRCMAGRRAQPRLVMLLAQAFDLDPGEGRDRDLIDDLLRRVWDDLVRLRLLMPRDAGRYLPLDGVALKLQHTSWCCPVTGRFLDTVFKGITPYLLGRRLGDGRGIQCGEPYALPRCDLLLSTFPSEAHRLRAIRGWLREDDRVATLRAEGLWSNLHDSTVEGAAYFRTAEHSAQQPAERLEKYEKLFKAAQINLLSCSTTMEMGVDIGGISAVSMNNVPPHPANYLQRTGRAGRRGESRSLALTLCKNNPHDQLVFSHPTWAFETRIAAPAVRLSSEVIVQRHVNALLLADFLRMKTSQGESDLTRLTCGWFFAPDSARGPADEMADRLRSLHVEPGLLVGLQLLVGGTPFDGASERVLADACAGELGRVVELWRGEHSALQEELAGMSGRAEKNDAAARGLQFRVERLSNEYLLRWMVGQGFLPVHGFPSSLVSFDTINLQSLKDMKSDRNGSDRTDRDDNPLIRRQLATRDRVTALREYAPGAEVVMDGVVYRSAGVTLNWHAPATATDLKENQNLRVAWRCTKCGASGSHPTRLAHCTACMAELDAANTFEMLVPNGFSVDFLGETHNDITKQSYVPVEEPWVHAAGDWVALPNPQLGRYRSTAHGSVIHYSAGPSGTGYAICLACGRAAPMSTDGGLPEVFRKEHHRLRGGRQNGDLFCPGSYDSWKIKPKLNLGHYAVTDVFELQLRDVQGLPLADRKAALTIAVALRDAAAAVLGVDSNEIGFGEKPVALPDGSRSRSILLFDHDAAGLVSSIEPVLPRILRKANDSLDCPAACDAICEHCLLQYDTRFLLRSLDRHRAREVLDSIWLQQLELPEEQRFFGPDSMAEPEPLFQAVTREWARPAAQRLVLPLHGAVDRWDLGSADVRARIYRLAEAGRPVRLVINSQQDQQLGADDCALLYTLAGHPSIEIHKTVAPVCQREAVIAAAVEMADGIRAWASADSGLGCPDAGWGVCDTVVVTGPLDSAALTGTEVTADSLRARASLESANELQITDALDGSSRGFGKRFWSVLRDRSSAFAAFHRSGDTVVGVNYSDRYITSPLAAALLVEVIHGLKEILDDRWEVPRVRVVTAQRVGTDAQAAGTVFADWSSDELRRDVLERALDNCAIDGVVRCLPRAELDHARLLDVEMNSGRRLRIHLDQGFGYWRVSHRSNKAFDFSQSSQHQAQAIAEMDVAVQGSRYPTYVFVTARQ